MSGEIEAAGALATAGLAARAIEGADGHGPGAGACLNCDTPLDGAYCHQCGQPAHISRTLGEALHDFLHSVLHFDTRAWRTFPMLVGRPGTLTNEYIHGRRARYVSPLALFLFTVFLMFFIFAVTGGGKESEAFKIDGPAAGALTDPVKVRELVGRARAADEKARRGLAAAEARAAEVVAKGDPGAEGVATGIVTGPRIRAEATAEALKEAEAVLKRIESRAAQKAPSPPGGLQVKVGPAPKSGAGATISVDGVSADGRWQDRLRKEAESGEINVNTGYKRLDEKITHALLNPDLSLYKLQQTAYKFSFLLVPISLPFIALLFLWRRSVTLFDHVVFSLYSLSFMSLLFVVVALLAGAGDWTGPVTGLLLCFVPPVHMFYHLKGTYALGWWSAFWRTVSLLIFVVFAAVLFIVSILFLGLGV
ncbi:MAG: DUF3667 domain-containing protein [Hyphomonadaceae bacterium]|nr:DUF3667 domain-containing protein [Hyphomonadaceae bacterium]